MSTYKENALQPGSTLAEYTIESVLGHGGFGITYLAVDTALGAHVAIKEYLPMEIAKRDKDSPTVIPHASRDAIRYYHWGLKNFVKEARALARFKHTNIVRVLRFIESHGTAYTVMEYEEGQTLAQHLKSNTEKLDEQALLRIVMPILNGLHAVHEVGLLHLDIKPDNIYLRRDGSPILIDFGSARQAMTEVSHSTRITLTHGYAPVEQYPDKGKLGPWSDVYALGATIYRCITGKRPDDSLDRYRAVLDYKVDPLKPAARAGAKNYQPQILECIDGALQIYAKDRPQSAREFQDSLMGRGRATRSASTPMATSKPASIGASRSPSNGPRARRGKSRPAPPYAGALITAAILGAVVWFGWSELQNPPAAVTPAPESVRPTPMETLPDVAAAPLPNPAPAPRVTTPPFPAKTPGDRAKAQAQAGGGNLPSTPRHVLAGHVDWVQAIAFAPGGKRLASASNDRTIRFWDVDSGTPLTTLKQNYAVNAVAYSPNGRTLAAAGMDGVVRLWDTQTTTASATLQGTGSPLYSVAYARDGNTLAAGGQDRTVHLWDTRSGRRHGLEGHNGAINALAFAPGGESLVSAGADRVIRIWNVDTKQESGALQGHKDPVLALAFSPDGRWLASGDAGNTIRLWDMRSLSPVRTITEVHQPVLALAFASNGARLIAGAADNGVHLIDIESGRVLQTLAGHEGFVQAVAVSSDGKTLASASRDQSVRLWESRK